jgi:hypothetical protein
MHAQVNRPRCAAYSHKQRQSKFKHNFEYFIAKMFHSHSVTMEQQYVSAFFQAIIVLIIYSFRGNYTIYNMQASKGIKWSTWRWLRRRPKHVVVPKISDTLSTKYSKLRLTLLCLCLWFYVIQFIPPTIYTAYVHVLPSGRSQSFNTTQNRKKYINSF